MVHFSEKINKDISVSIGIQNLVIGDLKGKTASPGAHGKLPLNPATLLADMNNCICAQII